MIPRTTRKAIDQLINTAAGRLSDICDLMNKFELTDAESNALIAFEEALNAVTNADTSFDESEEDDESA